MTKNPPWASTCVFMQLPAERSCRAINKCILNQTKSVHVDLAADPVLMQVLAEVKRQVYPLAGIVCLQPPKDYAQVKSYWFFSQTEMWF